MLRQANPPLAFFLFSTTVYVILWEPFDGFVMIIKVPLRFPCLNVILVCTPWADACAVLEDTQLMYSCSVTLVAAWAGVTDVTDPNINAAIVATVNIGRIFRIVIFLISALLRLYTVSSLSS